MAVSVEENISIARLSYQEGRYTEARSMLEGITGAHPEAVEAWKLLSYCLYALHQYQAAEHTAHTAIKASPSDPDCHYALALAMAAENRWGEAIKVYDHVLMLQPNHTYARAGVVDALIHHAKQLVHADNYQLAEQELDRAVKLAKTDSRPVVALAEFYIDTQRPQRAAPVVTAALQHGLSGPEITALAQRLGIRPASSVPTKAVVDPSAARQAVAQATQRQCPRCGLRSPDWLPKCANCGADMKTGKFTHAAANVKTEWQTIAYKIMAGLWVLLGIVIVVITGIGMNALRGTKSEDLQPLFILPMLIGILNVVVGMGLLLESESMQFIAKILLYLQLLGGSYRLVISMALGAWVEALINFLFLGLAGFLVYLVRYNAGE